MPFGSGPARGVLPPGASPLGQARELVTLEIPLMAFLPRLGLPLPRTERTGGAYAAFLGSRPRYAFLPPSGCCSVRESVPTEPTFKLARPAHPLLGFLLPRVCPPKWPRGFHPLRSRASSAARFDGSPLRGHRRSEPRPHHSVSGHPGSGPLSREAPPLPRFPAFRSSPVRGNAVLAYRLAPFASSPRWRHRSLWTLFEPSRPLPCGLVSARKSEAKRS